MVFSLFALFSAVLGQVWAVDDALLVDDQCSSSGECSLELMHLRSQKYPHDPLRLINRQIEDNKKYEVSVQDENGATCRPEGGAAITCSETHKCCTSKRSYLAGSSHDSQPRLALYAICCPLDTHCKFDTIFVSCAAGVGPDDYSGVIAGLQYDQKEDQGANSEAVALINRQIEDNKKYEVSVQDENGATCRPEGGAAITCSETHKCCTSKRSYLAGSSHDSQPRLALYAICCPLDTHCKFDTIFVSCAAGVGPDDYSGVIAGLQYDQNEDQGANSEAVALINRQIEDNKKYEVSVQDENGATCRPEGGAAITCSETHKCCTSKRSYLAGSSHDSQPRLALYAICCPLDTHCKFHTIFVSCAAGVGPDDYSGVIAG